MIGIVTRFCSAGIADYCVIGPIWAGLVIRGLWISCTVSAAALGQHAFGLSDSGDATEAGLQGSRSLVVGGELAWIGTQFPAFQYTYSTLPIGPMILPCYVPVITGSAWVVVGSYVAANTRLAYGLIVEPERLVQPSYERGPAARRVLPGGGVLSELRSAAEAARV